MKRIAISYAFLGMLAVAFAGDAWQPVSRLMPLEGNYRYRGSYTVKDGFAVRFTSKADGKSATVKLARSATVLSDWTGSPSTRAEHYITWLKNLPPGDDPSLEIVVKVRQDQWWVYLNNRPVLMLKKPFPLPATLELSKTNVLKDKRVQFQKITPFSFAAEFMDVEEGAKALSNWEKVGGVWKLHTVMQDAIEQHTSKKLSIRPVVPTHSPNFYSLEGSGDGLLLTGYPFEDNYRVQASIQTGPVECGLTFYHQDARNYYTFGFEGMGPGDDKAFFKLIRYSSAYGLPARNTLAVVQVKLTNGQWVMPEIRANNNRLTCYLDNRKIIELNEHLPVGGRYGLYIAGDKDKGIARFDDVNVRSVTSVPLPDLRTIRFHTIDSENNMYEQESSILQFLKGNNRNPMGQQWIESSISGKPRWLAIGSADHPAHTFGATFKVHSRVFDIGILIGYKDRENPYYRYRCIFDGDTLKTVCEEIDQGKETALLERSVPFSRQQLGENHQLSATTTADGLAKLYFNGKLIFVQPIDHSEGASGVYLGASTQARISDFDYVFEPALEYVNKYEKNPVFVTDPFMKHWSSPEGEWFTNPITKETWHKSDFFSEYSLTMPWVVGSEIHLSVEEQKKEGQAFLKVAPDGRLQLIYRGNVVLTMDLPETAFKDPDIKAGKKAAYSVHYSGQAIWVSSGKKVLGVHHLRYSLKGSKVRVKGFKNEHLAATLSRRHGVYDALFTQALHDWNVGGGKWQVINRFQCKPTFSHLNGESPDGPAFLWSKHTFKGDFCVEFYVGLRHGDWYKLSGRDFNITIMNDEASPASGYTVTCAGWEPNEMQRLTRLYKNGELVESSQTYTAPQVRSGNKRKLFDPILQRGRDVHGAWYYIKLRRRGKKLEYFFDNEKILSWTDPEPISAGSLGIWTYRNSMMVARVKVSAESVEPSWFPIRSMTRVPGRPEPQPLRTSMELTAHDRPLDIMRPKYWKTEPLSTHCTTRWSANSSTGSPSVVQKNAFGGGTMLLGSELPMLPLSKVAGIRFSVKRTEGTQFNFHYNLHQSPVKGSLPIKRYIYRLSGNGFETPDWKIAGATDLPPLSVETFNRPGNWTDVVVWFPSHLVNTPMYHVNVLGFGNLDPSYVQQGLEGNMPGASYAVSNASLIFNEKPLIKTRMGAKGNYRLRGVQGHRYARVVKEVGEIAPTLEREQRPGVNACEITLDSSEFQFQPVQLYWNRVPAEPTVRVEWHPNIPYAVKITNSSHVPELAVSTISANEKAMTLSEMAAGEHVGYLPITAIDDQPQVQLKYRLKQVSRTATLSYSDSPAGLYPVLKELAGPVARIVDGDAAPSGYNRLMASEYNSTERRYLTFQNQKYGSRLIAPFNQVINVSRYPIMAFRYNCDPSAQISIDLGAGKLAFTESLETSGQRARYASAKRDGMWQSWMGVIGDLQFEQAYSKSHLQLNRLQFGSTSTIDQTGRYSRFSLDNFVIGPVINKADDLSFTPTFVCPGGIKLVEYTVISGHNSLHDLSDKTKKGLVWRAIQNGAPFTPELSVMRHPVGRLVIRAASTAGILSQPFEIPFMIDRVEPKGTSQFVTENQPGSNGEFLSLTFATGSNALDDGGAPIDLSKLAVLADNKPIDIPKGTIRLKHKGTSDSLLIDWPYLLRHQLKLDHKQVGLMFTGVEDGAGNRSKDVAVTVSIPDKDSRPPTWINMNTSRALSINQSYVFPWTNPEKEKPLFQGSRATTARYIHEFNKAPYIRLRGYKSSVYGYLQIAPGKWKLDKFPYLSLAARLPKGGVAGRYYIEMQGHGDAVVKIPLEFKADAGNQVSKGWNYFTFDVGKRFNKYLRKRNLSKNYDPKIWNVAIRGVKTSNNLEIDIKDILIHTSWTPHDTLELDSYDASVISHYEYTLMRGDIVIQKGRLPGSTVKPFDLAPTGETGDWILFYSVDTKGNRSHPLRLPIAK